MKRLTKRFLKCSFFAYLRLYKRNILTLGQAVTRTVKKSTFWFRMSTQNVGQAEPRTGYQDDLHTLLWVLCNLNFEYIILWKHIVSFLLDLSVFLGHDKLKRILRLLWDLPVPFYTAQQLCMRRDWSKQTVHTITLTYSSMKWLWENSLPLIKHCEWRADITSNESHTLSRNYCCNVTG